VAIAGLGAGEDRVEGQRPAYSQKLPIPAKIQPSCDLSAMRMQTLSATAGAKEEKVLVP
jgi:hypothetical protein